MKLQAFLALAVAAIWSGPAGACMQYKREWDPSAVWETLPPKIDPEMYVAAVTFEHPAGWEELAKGARARVRHRVQGNYRGQRIVVQDAPSVIECYNPFHFEGRGFVIGRPIGYREGVLVIRPVYNYPGMRIGRDIRKPIRIPRR